MPLYPDILNEDCSDISDWTDIDSVNGVSEVSPAGKFRLDANAHATGNKASIKRLLSSMPDPFTLEVSLYHDALGTLFDGDDDYFVISFEKTGFTFYAAFASDGLFIVDNAFWRQVGTNLVSTATQQKWRLQVDCTAKTVEVFLNGTSQGTVGCDYNNSTYGDKYCALRQLGKTTDNMLTHVDYIKIATGLGEIYEDSTSDFLQLF